MVCPAPPDRGHLGDCFLLGVSESVLTIRVDPRTLPLLGLSLPPVWWPRCLLCPVVSCCGCCEHNADQGSRGHEGQKHLARAPGLRGPGSTPPVSLMCLRNWSCKPRPGCWAAHCVILGAAFPATGSLGPPRPLWVRVGLSSNTDHSSHHSLLPEGLDFSFWTVCIETQWCQIKP